MTDSFFVKWAVAVQHSLQSEIERQFPKEIHKWPILKAFDFEGYTWNATHLIVILRDKIAGIPNLIRYNTLDDSNAPIEKPNIYNIQNWQNYILEKFSLRTQDLAIIIPLIEKGPKVEEDWNAWSQNDKDLWFFQLKLNIERHFYYIKGFDVISDFFIPPGYQFLADECERFFKDYSNYAKNVFIMTRFVPGNKPLEGLDSEIRRVLRSHSLNPLRADDKMYLQDRNLWNNVCVYMICCKYGIAILEDKIVNEFNPNVAIEYGFMRALNKPVLLLADLNFHNLRADIIGTLRGQFDITNIKETIETPIKIWLKELDL